MADVNTTFTIKQPPGDFIEAKEVTVKVNPEHDHVSIQSDFAPNGRLPHHLVIDRQRARQLGAVLSAL